MSGSRFAYMSETEAPGRGGAGRPWGGASPSPPGALGWVVSPHPLGAAAPGWGRGVRGERPTPRGLPPYPRAPGPPRVVYAQRGW